MDQPLLSVKYVKYKLIPKRKHCQNFGSALTKPSGLAHLILLVTFVNLHLTLLHSYNLGTNQPGNHQRLIRSVVTCSLLRILYKSKLGCKDQESIQSSTTPDPGYQWESDNLIVDTTNESRFKGVFVAKLSGLRSTYL